MPDTIDARRRGLGFAVLGGPTTVIDVAGLRIVIDPTFDPPGEHRYLTKTAGPVAGTEQLGAVDVVLVSHDEHPDNLDTAGRAFAQSVPVLLTHPRAALRLGPTARGLEAWETVDLPGGHGHAVAVQAVPAVHGPADGQRDERGFVNCEVTGFVLSGTGIPTIYLSGDNASIGAVRSIRDRVGEIDIAVLFAGAARVSAKERNRPLTLTGQRAAAAAEVLGAKVVIPAHLDGWAHFSEGLDEFVTAFDEAGLGHLVATAPHGQWIEPDSAAV